MRTRFYVKNDGTHNAVKSYRVVQTAKRSLSALRLGLDKLDALEAQTLPVMAAPSWGWIVFANVLLGVNQGLVHHY